MPGQLSITELQSLYRMLRGKLTSATFSVENSIDFVNATNNMASSFFSSIPFNIHSLKNRSEALQTEVLDMDPIIENLATELATARMNLLCQNTWFKKTSEQEGILIELKKQLTMISTNTSYDQLLKKI